MQKLLYALHQAHRVAYRITEIIHQADESTKGFFSNLI
jgi:hypothetical protein